jgi:hypothetical protein
LDAKTTPQGVIIASEFTSTSQLTHLEVSGDGCAALITATMSRDPVAGFLRRRDAAMYLACCGWCLPKPRRGAQAVDAVLHRVRWETAVSTRVGGFKVNNSLALLYARMFHETYPAHSGFFRMRVSKYDVALPPGGSTGLIVGSVLP